MSQVDFYVIPEDSSREYFACALIQKVWSQGERVFVYMSSESSAEAFDDLLWTFKDTSFVPHALTADDGLDKAPVMIGYEEETINRQLSARSYVLLNLTDQIPQTMDKPDRILEIVFGDEQERQLARKKYTQYRNQDYVLNRHAIESSYG